MAVAKGDNGKMAGWGDGLARAWNRIRPRSIRARVTVGTIAGLAVVTGLGVFMAFLLLRETFVDQALDRAELEALNVAGDIMSERYPGYIPDDGYILGTQIVERDTHEVLASSQALSGQPPLTERQPDLADTLMEETVCGHEGGADPDSCLLVVGYSLTGTSYGDVMVLTAARPPLAVSSHALETVLVGMYVILLSVTGLVVWYGVGRALRPVEEISAEFDTISATELDRRLAVPRSQDEIAHLARTANSSLERMEEAVLRQRRFVSDASHELRNPIAGMRTKLELELSEPHPNIRDRERLLKSLLSDAERLENIVSDLLELARPDSDVAEEREPVDMCALVEEEFAGRRYRVPTHTRLRGEAWVTGSRVRLTRLLTNLVANAERHARSRVEVVVEHRGENVVITVHDDGAGIPESERERIFERFARLDESMERDPEGSGLGLAISREIAQAKGGTLVAGHSDLLGGAAFTLTMPAAQDATGSHHRTE